MALLERVPGVLGPPDLRRTEGRSGLSPPRARPAPEGGVWESGRRAGGGGQGGQREPRRGRPRRPQADPAPASLSPAAPKEPKVISGFG